MVAIAVKKVTYRSVKIFSGEFFDVGQGHLGIYRPPGGSEVVFIEQFADETILRLFPARVDTLGQGFCGTPFPLALALTLRRFFGPLGSRRGSNGSGKVGVWRCIGSLEEPRSTRLS